MTEEQGGRTHDSPGAAGLPHNTPLCFAPRASAENYHNSRHGELVVADDARHASLGFAGWLVAFCRVWNVVFTGL